MLGLRSTLFVIKCRWHSINRTETRSHSDYINKHTQGLSVRENSSLISFNSTSFSNNVSVACQGTWSSSFSFLCSTVRVYSKHDQISWKGILLPFTFCYVSQGPLGYEYILLWVNCRASIEVSHHAKGNCVLSIAYNQFNSWWLLHIQ